MNLGEQAGQIKGNSQGVMLYFLLSVYDAPALVLCAILILEAHAGSGEEARNRTEGCHVGEIYEKPVFYDKARFDPDVFRSVGSD